MDIGKDVTKVWQRLDEYVMTDSQRECHKIEVEGGAIANRLDDAQVGLLTFLPGAGAHFSRNRKNKCS